MAKAQKEIQQVNGKFRAVVYVEYPQQSALSISPEKFLCENKRVDLAKSDLQSTREDAEAQFPELFKVYGIRQ